jgi:outer membrane protein W
MIGRLTVASAAFLGCALAAPLGVGAQPRSGDGFLFGMPRGSISLRAGFALPTASSDVFAFSHDNLTVGRGDFAGSTVSADAAFTLTPRLALQASAGYSGRTVPSEFRDWVDNNDLPIEQSSVLRRIPLTIGLRYYLVPPGRSLGRLAWVPTRLAPYVGAGVGQVWYRFRQSGDFVDYQTLDVFNETLESSSWAPTGYGAVGLDYALNAKVGLVTEARYDYARARMGIDFEGFDRIDLSGFSATVGLAFRF